VPDQINEQAVQLTAAAPVQLDSFTPPAGVYPGTSRSSGGRVGNQMKWSKPRYHIVLTAADLAAYGEPVSPDAVNREIDITDLVELGLITVD